MMNTEDKKVVIARRVAAMFKDGDHVNLGIGLPTMCANYAPEGVKFVLQAENGMLNAGPTPAEEDWDFDVHDAGGSLVTPLAGASFFDSVMSFTMIRGGHMDATVLGGMEVDEEGNLANYMIPGKIVAGMGGAMDLCAGAKKVIIAMEHCTKDGSPKIRKHCTLPLTAAKRVSTIVTEYCVIDVTPKGLLLREVKEGMTAAQVQELTEATLIIHEPVPIMKP